MVTGVPSKLAKLFVRFSLFYSSSFVASNDRDYFHTAFAQSLKFKLFVFF